MFIIANFILAIAQILDYLLWAYMWIIIARAIISWVDADPGNPIVRFIYTLTDPVLERVRAVVPLVAGGFDLSPIVVWIAILFLRRFLVQSLYDLAYALH
ncbi:MAG TPA: YggT family protein [Candidatus Eisenbacteria bacterium]|nr:YggT family protein [Candidatus Eisenbacteria bacterium]